MTQYNKKQPVFKPAEEEGSVHIDPPLKAAEKVEIFADDPTTGAVEPVSEKQILNNWKEITIEQQTGGQFLVTHDIDIDAIQAYWKKTRVMLHFRWVLNGKWCNSLTNQYLIPQPIYYKEIK